MKYIIPLLIFFGIGGLLFVSSKGVPSFTLKSEAPVVMMQRSEPDFNKSLAPAPPSTVAPVPAPVPAAGPSLESTATFWFRLCISIVGFAASLFIILSHKVDDAMNKWGYSTIGMILGFWLK